MVLIYIKIHAELVVQQVIYNFFVNLFADLVQVTRLQSTVTGYCGDECLAGYGK